MVTRINSNLAGTYSATRLNQAHDAFNQSLERIATGRRINSSADDASGMSIAGRLRSQALGMGQAMKNASDAISITQTADGALGDITDIINTIRVKSLQAASDGQTTDTRQAIQADIDNALAALDQVAETTSFNGQKLLSGEFTNKQFMIDPNTGGTIDLSIDAALSSHLGNTGDGNALSSIDVTTREGAESAVGLADNALSQVNRIRSSVGSTQNQLTSTIENLSSSQISAFQSESQIMDVDLAEEAMTMNQMEVMLKARTFALAQANAAHGNITALLG